LPKKIHTTKNETRSFDISATRDAEHERVFTISISSEEPYKRYGETEILGHMENEIDLSFFKSGNAPILLHHNTREQIGVIEDAWIENNRLRGRIKISRNRDDIVRDIEDGIIKNISVGYSVLKIKSIGDKAYRATFWKPYEASIVSIPADQTVGINRSEGSLEGIMDPEDDIKIEISDARKKAGEEERTRCREILAMGRRFDCSEQADKAIESAASINDFRKQVLEIVLDKQKIKSETVLVESQQEISEKGREYSILRAAEAMASGDWRYAGYEREVSEFLQKKYKQEAKAGGILVPMHIRTPQTSGSPAAGGYLVGTEHRGDMFIDALRARTTLDRVGAFFMSGLTQNVEIPALLSGVAFEWVPENDPATEGAPVWGQVKLEPKTLTSNIPISRRLANQSSPDAEAILRRDMVAGSAVAIEKAAYKGGGSNQPNGIISTTAVIGTPFATANDPTYEELVFMQTKIDSANAFFGRLATITNPVAYGKMRVKKVDSGSGIFLVKEGMAADYPIHSTNCMEPGYTIFGNWEDLIVAQFGALEIVSVRSSITGGFNLGIFVDCDIAVKQPKAFCIAKAGQTSK